MTVNQARAHKDRVDQTGALLEIRDLDIRFHTYRGVIHALEGVNLAIAPGEAVGLVGETGCGKSVTARAVIGMLELPGRPAVVGSGQASMHVAAQLGSKFSIIAPRDGGGSKTDDNPWKYGFVRAYASTRGCGISVMDLGRDRAGALARLTEAGQICIQQDGADVLILGCMSMAFHDITRLLQERLQVPVVNPVPAGLAFAELCVRTGLTHSKKAYPTPPKLEML